MTRREELNLFLERADEFIESKYILADIKIVNLLKSIATSNTLLAVFKNCLTNFDYFEAKKKYLVGNKYMTDERGEFILPPSSRELLAFIFNLLVEIDSKKIDFSEFIKKYFYEDGSFSAGYSAFINAMIKPFRNSVKMLMESVIDGKLQDPIEALTEEEEKKAKELAEKNRLLSQEKEDAKKTYGNSLKTLRSILLVDKKKIKESRLKQSVKDELTLAVDMLANVIESTDKDAINYAFITYKYCVKAHKFLFFNRGGKVSSLIRDIINGL